MKKRPYIVTMFVLVAIFLIGHRYARGSVYIEIITTVLAIIAAVAFWMEFRSNERINEAQLIMELNDQFVSNEQFAEVEWKLEKYYASYQNAKKTGEDVSQILLDMDLSMDKQERQHLVNYLVHLEGIAALVHEGVLRSKVVTNLMAYRYFIAVNNPIVQKNELLPYEDYYQGCFAIYEKWSKTLGQDKVPMNEYALIDQADTSANPSHCKKRKNK